MADFNLSAQVNLQLAAGTVQKIVNDANEQFKNIQLVPKVDDKKLVDEAKKGAAKAKKAVQKFDIPFNFVLNTTDIQKKLLGTPFKVKIELAAGQQEKFRNELAGLFDITRKGVKLMIAELNDAERKANAAGNKPKNSPKGQQLDLDGIKAVELATQRLEDQTAKANALKDAIRGVINTIDAQAAAEAKLGKVVKRTGTLFQDLSDVAAEMTKASGGNLDKVVQRFELFAGANGPKALESSIRKITLALKTLKMESGRLDAIEKIDKNIDLSNARSEIEKTNGALIDLLYRSELFDGAALSKAITNSMKGATRAVAEANGEAKSLERSFERIEAVLKGKIVFAQETKSGKSKDESAKEIKDARANLALFRKLKKEGAALEDIKIQLKISDANITSFDKATAKIDTFTKQVNSFKNSLNVGDFGETFGAKTLNIAKKGQEIAQQTIAALKAARSAGATDVELINISDKGKQDLNQLKVDAKALTKIKEDLEARKTRFVIEGLPQAEAAIDQLIQDLSNGTIALNNFAAAKKTIGQSVNIIEASVVNEKDLQRLPEFLKGVTNLKEASEELNKKLAASGKQTGRFYQFAQKTIEELSNSTANLGDRFKGLNGSQVENLSRAIIQLYKETSRLDTLRGKAQDIFDPQTRNAVLANIDAVEQKIRELFMTMDVSNTSAMSANIAQLTSGLNTQFSTAIRTSTRQVEDLDKALNSLSSQRIKTIGSSTSNRNEQVDTLAKLIAKVNEFKDAGKSLEDLNLNADYLSLRSLLDGLVKSGTQTDTVIGKFQKLKALLSTRFAGLNIPDQLGIDDRAQAILDKYTKTARDLANNTTLGPQKKATAISINDAQGKAEISTLTNEVVELLNQFDRLNNEELKLRTAGLVKSADDINRLRTDVGALINSTVVIPSVSKQISDGLIKIAQGAESEKKLERYITTVDRLRASLVSLDGEDLANVTGKLNKLEQDLRNISAGGGTDRQLKDTLSKGTFDARQAQKFNNVVSDTTDKLEQLAFQQKVPKSAEAFREASVEFNRFAKEIASSSAPALDKLRQIENKTKAIIFLAKVKADGGFFDSFAKSAGLAAKRLGAFLGLAQGLYGIQAVITESIRTAVALDKEFIKLQQVFSTELSGNALAEQVAETSKQILALGKNYGVATTEVAAGAKIFAQAGIAGQDLAKILEVVTKTELGPSFENIGETAEATIAFMNQFGISANEVEAALGGVNRVSAKFPVEAGGITAAVRRAGSTFDATGDKLEDFVAAFTVVKTATREADETIATALRNIASRIQRNQTQKYLQDAFGISLLNEQGLFVGFNKSIELIGDKIKQLGIDSSDPRFATLLDELAGQRQAGKLKPLIENFEDLKEITEDYRKGAGSIDSDALAALDGIENKLMRAKAAVIELFTEIGRSAVVKGLVDSFTNLTIILTNVVRGFNGVTAAALAMFAAVKAAPIISSSLQFGIAEILPHFFQKGKLLKRNTGGPSGETGLIPGGGPNKDSILAYLTKGEYVLKRFAVKKYGLNFLNRLNNGDVQTANSGGLIGFNNGGLNNNSGSAGTLSSIINVFSKVIKKMLNFGNIVESTSQEIATGMRLPEVLSKDLGTRSESININPADYMKDAAQVLIDQIKGAGAFKQKETELPPFNPVELPTSIMDSIIEDALKPDKKSTQKAPEYKGNSEKLRGLAKDAGIDIPENIFKNLFKGVEIVDAASISDRGKAGGSYNKKTKITKFTESSVLNPKIVAHEIGHGVSNFITGKLQGVVAGLSKGGIAQSTRTRMSKSGLYGKEGSKEFEGKFNSELVADIFKHAVENKSNPNAKIDDEEKGLLNLFTKILKEQSGISIGPRSKDVSGNALELSGLIDGLKSTSTERALGAGVKLPGSLTKPLDPKSQALIDQRNAREIRSSSSDPTPILDIIRRQGGAKTSDQPKESLISKISKTFGPKLAGGGGGGNPPNGPKDTPALRSAAALKVFDNSVKKANTNLLKMGGLGGVITTAALAFGFFGDKLLGTGEALQILTGIIAASAAKVALLNAVSDQGKKLAGIDTISQIKDGVLQGPSNNPANKLGKAEYNQRAGGFLNSQMSPDEKKAIAQEIAAKKKAAHYAKPENAKRALERSQGLGAYAGPKPGKISSGVQSGRNFLNGLGSKINNFGTPRSLLGRAASGIGSVASKIPGAGIVKSVAGSAAESTAGRVVGKAGSLLGSAAKGIGSTVVKSKGNILAVAAIGAGEALGYFASKAEESADLALAAATNETDALAAMTKKRRAQTAKQATGKLATIATGAVTGAAVGGGPIGAVLGTIAGTIAAFLPEIGKAFGVDLVTPVKNFFKSIGDYVGSFYGVASEYVGLFMDKVGDFLAWAAGTLDKRREQQTEDKKSAARIGGIGRAGNEVRISDGSAAALYNRDNVGVVGRTVKGGIKQIKDKGGIDNLSDWDKERRKNEAEALKSTLQKIKSPKERVEYIDAMKKAGVDIQEFFKQTGTEFDFLADEAEVALSKMGLFFARMQETLDRSSARFSGIEAGIEFFADSANKAFAPDQLFDVIKLGFNPKDLGFDKVSGALDPLINQAKSFDPKFAQGVEFERNGLETARKITSGLAAQPDNLKLEKVRGQTPQDALEAYLEETFKANNTGGAELEDQFNKFLTANAADLEKAIDSSGNVDIAKTNEIVGKFAEGLDKGFIDNLKRINEINQKFSQEYGQLMQKLVDKQKEATGFELDNVGVTKEKNDILNKASGLTGTKLLAQKGRQARSTTDQTLDLKLKGTGLDSNASIQDIGAKLRAAEDRQRNPGKYARDELTAKFGAGNFKAQDVTQRQTEISISAGAEAESLGSALKYFAEGTDEFTHAIESFNIAAEKAAKSSAFLTDNLLGTDDQLMQTVRGLQFSSKIESLPQNQRLGALANAGQADRQAYGSLIQQQGEEGRQRFQDSLGIGPNLMQLPETQAALGKISEKEMSNQEQQLASEAALPDMKKSIADLQAFYQQQFNSTNNTLNAFNQAVTKAGETFSKIPTEINHTMKIDSTINIVGADFLAKSTAAMQAVIDAAISEEIAKYDANLKKGNEGLNSGVSPVSVKGAGQTANPGRS